jgi:IS605 OrfB family transposase
VKIKSLQRQLSRKKKGTENSEKVKLAIAESWRKVRKQRGDFVHKLSYKLATENSVIIFEDLNLQNLVKNHNPASAILDSTWGKLRQLTAYKAERRSGRVVLRGLFTQTQFVGSSPLPETEPKADDPEDRHRVEYRADMRCLRHEDVDYVSPNVCSGDEWYCQTYSAG